MPAEIIHKEIIAESDGLAAPGLVLNATNWLGGNKAWHAAPAVASDWIRIPTRRGDRLRLQYRAKILNNGGITANATNNMTMAAIGDTFTEQDPDLLPLVAASAPPTSGTAIEQNDGLLFRFLGPARSENAVQHVRVCQNHGVAAISGLGIFLGTTAPANDSIVSWTIEIGEYDASIKTTGGDPFPGVTPVSNRALSVAMLDAVYLSLTNFFTGTSGTAANLRIKYKMRAIVLRETK